MQNKHLTDANLKDNKLQRYQQVLEFFQKSRISQLFQQSQHQIQYSLEQNKVEEKNLFELSAKNRIFLYFRRIVRCFFQKKLMFLLLNKEISEKRESDSFDVEQFSKRNFSLKQRKSKIKFQDFQKEQSRYEKYNVHYEDHIQQKLQSQIQGYQQVWNNQLKNQIDDIDGCELYSSDEQQIQIYPYEQAHIHFNFLKEGSCFNRNYEAILLKQSLENDVNHRVIEFNQQNVWSNTTKQNSIIDPYGDNSYHQYILRINCIKETMENFEQNKFGFGQLLIFLQKNSFFFNQIYQYIQYQIKNNQRPNLQYPILIKIDKQVDCIQFKQNFEKSSLKYHFKLSQEPKKLINPQIYKFSFEQLREITMLSSIATFNSSKNQNIELDQIVEKITEIISFQNIISFRQNWRSFCLDFLDRMVQNFEVYSQFSIESLRKLIKVYFYRSFQKQDVYQHICPGITKIMNNLSQKVQIQPINRTFIKYNNALKINQQIPNQVKVQNFLKDFNFLNKLNLKKYSTSLDQIFFNFILQANQNLSQSKILKYLVNFQNTKIPLGPFISNYAQFYTGISNWLDLFTEFQFKRKEAYEKIGTNEFSLLYQQAKPQFFEEIEFQKLPDYHCLGCTSFFYLGNNIEDHSVNFTPIECLSSIRHLKNNNQFMLLKAVVSLLNSGGGLIFFDTKRQYRKTLTYGIMINESNKEKLRQQITLLLRQKIVPKIDILNQIRIDFVPVKESPYRASRSKNKEYYSSYMAQLRQNEYYYSREFLKGIYVVRIRVSPQDSSKLYGINNQLEVNYYIRERGRIILLNCRQVVKIIKKKMKKFFIKDSEKQNWNIFKYFLQNIFDHECKLPQDGRIITENIEFSQEDRKQYQYEQMFIIIVRSKNIQIIQNRLTEKGYISIIQQKFLKYRFKSTRHTAIMYINASYDEVITNITKNSYFNLEDKMLLALLVTTHIRYGNDREQRVMTRQNFNNLKYWISRQYPFQIFKFYEYLIEDQNNLAVSKKEYYFQTQTKTCCLFLYYILHHYSQPSLMKDPKNLVNLTKEDKERRWKLIFSSADSN